MHAVVTGSADAWNAHLSLFSPRLRDVYFTHEWHDLFAGDLDAAPMALLFRGNRGTLVLSPFLLRRVPARLSDRPLFACESAYGYGGPLTEHPDPDDLAEADAFFCDWARSHDVVAEFVRFHPLLETHLRAGRGMIVEENRLTVPVFLDAPYEILAGRFSPAKRRNIKKAVRAGVSVCRGDDYGGFWRMYDSTMDRLSAAEFYHFRGPHRARLERLVSRCGFLLEARIGERLVGAAIFLRSAGFLHYHLGGSDAAALGVAPNDRLMAEAIRLGLESGAAAVHLGGGATTSPDDTLLRFKRGFSPALAAFRTGKRVHDPERHARLLRRWQETADGPPAMFLQYLETI